MGAQLHLGVILAVVSAAFAEKGINVTCLKDSVDIKWRISAEFVPFKARFFLGNCKPSNVHVLPSGVGELQFHYRFDGCRFKPKIKGKNILHENKLTFRPQQKGNPANFEYTIQCLTKRSDIWVPPYLNPGAGSSEARGGLLFHMALLNDQLTGISQNNVIRLGSFMPIWAAVDQKSHQPLLLLMEECFAATTSKLHADSQVYPLITNKGCLLESKRGNAVFLPRHHSSSVILYLQSFRFGLGQEVYIHCKLVAWDPDRIDKTKKACHYSKASKRWELLDGPENSSICSCCASNCKARHRRHTDNESEGLRSISVVGPLYIVDQFDTGKQDANTGSFSTVV